MESERINLQVPLHGDYAKAFRMFQARNQMDGRSNITTIMAILRTLPEYQEAAESTKKVGA